MEEPPWDQPYMGFSHRLGMHDQLPIGANAFGKGAAVDAFSPGPPGFAGGVGNSFQHRKGAAKDVGSLPGSGKADGKGFGGGWGEMPLGPLAGKGGWNKMPTAPMFGKADSNGFPKQDESSYEDRSQDVHHGYYGHCERTEHQARVDMLQPCGQPVAFQQSAASAWLSPECDRDTEQWDARQFGGWMPNGFEGAASGMLGRGGSCSLFHDGGSSIGMPMQMAPAGSQDWQDRDYPLKIMIKPGPSLFGAPGQGLQREAHNSDPNQNRKGGRGTGLVEGCPPGQFDAPEKHSGTDMQAMPDVPGHWEDGQCRWHKSAETVGVISEDGHVFSKTAGPRRSRVSNRGAKVELASICMVFDSSLRYGGVHRYTYEIMDGELGAADGAGFVFDSKVRRNNIQRMRSVFLNQRGRICLRNNQQVTKLQVQLPPLTVGVYLDFLIDLDNLIARFNVSNSQGAIGGSADVSLEGLFDIGVSLEQLRSGFFCAVVTGNITIGLR